MRLFSISRLYTKRGQHGTNLSKCVALVLLLSCIGEDIFQQEPSITIKDIPRELRVGAKFVLAGEYRDESNVATTPTSVWTSSNPGVASVSPEGVLQGISAGSADITAQTEGVTSNARTVRVIAGPVITKSRSGSLRAVGGGEIEGTASLAILEDARFEVTVKDLELPGDAPELFMHLSAVSQNITGGVEIGVLDPAAITTSYPFRPAVLLQLQTYNFLVLWDKTKKSTYAYSELGCQEIEGTCETLMITSPPESIFVGTIAIVEAQYRNNLGELDPGEMIDWGSSDTAIATVSGAGELTGISPGMTTISCEAGTLTRTFDLTVEQRDQNLRVTSQKRGSFEASMRGNTLSGSATILEYDNENFEVRIQDLSYQGPDGQLHLSNSKSSAEDGLFIGTAASGNRTYRALSDAADFSVNTYRFLILQIPDMMIFGFAEFSCAAESCESLSIVGAPDMPIQTGIEIPLTVTYFDPAGRDVTPPSLSWMTSDIAVATITSGGSLTGVSAGEVDVTAMVGSGIQDSVRVEFVAVPPPPPPPPADERTASFPPGARYSATGSFRLYEQDGQLHLDVTGYSISAPDPYLYLAEQNNLRSGISFGLEGGQHHSLDQKTFVINESGVNLDSYNWVIAFCKAAGIVLAATPFDE